jgi:hypothetical protein
MIRQFNAFRSYRGSIHLDEAKLCNINDSTAINTIIGIESEEILIKDFYH